MKLLTDKDYAEIRAAVQDVTDTFMETPVIYYRHAGMNDSNMEDNVTEGWRVHNFKALTEFLTGIEAAKLKQFPEGSFDYGDITLTANIDDMILAGLIDVEDMPNTDTSNDYFKCNGITYKVHDVALDGPLQKKQVLVVLSGKLEMKIKKFTNIIT